MNELTKTMRACVVAKIIGEVRELLTIGKIPNTVSSFSELHDHIDANELGGFCEDAFVDPLIAYFGGRNKTDEGMPDAFLQFMNECQEDVDKWLDVGNLQKVDAPNKNYTEMITITDRRKKERRVDFRLLEQFMYVENDRRQDFSDSDGGNTQENRQGATRRDGEDRRMIGGSGSFINPRNTYGSGYSIKQVWDEFTHDVVLLRDGRYIAITTGEEQFLQLSIYRDEDHFNEPYSSTVPLATVLINEDGHIDVSYDKNHRKVNA